MFDELSTPRVIAGKPVDSFKFLCRAFRLLNQNKEQGWSWAEQKEDRK